MCFSPQADVGGGVLICAIGVDAVRHIRQRRQFIALAWIPVLPGAHQFIEALVWPPVCVEHRDPCVVVAEEPSHLRPASDEKAGRGLSRSAPWRR